MASGWRAFAVWLGIAAVAAWARGAPWPAAETDLPVDPQLRTGMLPNGLRYFVLPNAEPKNRISLRLVVAVGALHEEDDESGLAHFVEHMAFRGTRTHPAGSLTQALQRLGVGRGPDNTAFTFLDHTQYHLELPDAAEATLHEGLAVMREYAAEVTFDPALIDRERRVILNENASRDTPTARGTRANLEFLWPHSRPVRRPPGGTTESLRQLTRAQFVSFYDAWYRPDRMAIVVVGDVNAKLAVHAIEQELAALQPRGPARPEPADLVPAAASRSNVFIFADPALFGVQLTFEHPFRKARDLATHAERVRQLRQNVACTLLQARLQRIALEPAASFVAPTAQLLNIVPDWQAAVLSVSGKTDDWKQLAAEVEREHRRAFELGFTAGELDEAKRNYLAILDESVRMAPTRRSEWLAEVLVQGLVAGNAFVTPAALQKDLAPEVAALTRADCRSAFREMWSVHAPHVLVTANPSFRVTREEIGAALNGSRESAVQQESEPAPGEFAYTAFGPPGRIVRDEPVADLDLRLSEFGNGVKLNFKATTFESDVVEIRVRVGDGRLSQPRTKPGLDLLANAVTTAGGLGRHPGQELSRLLAGRNVSVAFNVDNDAGVFSARSSRRDVLLALQIIAAYLTDPGFRPEPLREARARFGTMYGNMPITPGALIAANALREITGGDSRFGVPPAGELAARDPSEVKDWLEPQFKAAPIELSIVGDVTWEEASAAVGRTLGALPARRTRDTASNPAGMLKPVRPPVAPWVYGLDPKLKQGGVAWYCPVAQPLTDIHEDRRCRLLAEILTDRVQVRLRDELGAAYSAGASFNEINGFPNLDYFVVYAEVAPTELNRAMAIIEREIMSLALRGVSAEEFDRVKPPYLHAMDDNLRTNLYWGATVLSDAQQHPERLDAARDRTQDIRAMTRQEVSAVAQRHLDVSRAFKFVTTPASVPVAPAAMGQTQPSSVPAFTATPGPLSPGNMSPVAIYQVRPMYPKDMMDRQMHGEVTIDFVVDVDGNVQNPRPIQQTNALFAEAAVECVKQWKFRPGLRNGKPAAYHMHVPIVFEPAR